MIYRWSGLCYYIYCAYKAKFLILECRSFARYLLCNCMVVYSPYSIWSGQYGTYTPKRSLTCGAQSMFSDRSGLAEVGWEPASSTLHRRSRCQSATGAPTRPTTFASFFSALLDEEHISVILTWTVLCDEKNRTQSEMGSTSPFLAQYPSTQQWEVPTRCRCGKL